MANSSKRNLIRNLEGRQIRTADGKRHVVRDGKYGPHTLADLPSYHVRAFWKASKSVQA